MLPSGRKAWNTLTKRMPGRAGAGTWIHSKSLSSSPAARSYEDPALWTPPNTPCSALPPTINTPAHLQPAHALLPQLLLEKVGAQLAG